MNYKVLSEQLIRHEGLRLKPYLDTVGKTSIGFGRNLSDMGITGTEAVFLLRNDIDNAYWDVMDVFGRDVFDGLGEVRQGVLINMLFNLGRPRFLTFVKMIAAVKKDDFEEAARQMKDSRWYRQVGCRAIELVWQMRHNEFGDFA